jgi:hypothetical protein
VHSIVDQLPCFSPAPNEAPSASVVAYLRSHRRRRFAARADGTFWNPRSPPRHRLAAVPQHRRSRRGRRILVWGDGVFILTAISGQRDAGPKVGPYGDIAPVRTTLSTNGVSMLSTKDGTGRMAPDGPQGRPRIKRHTKSSHANSTLATDGERIVPVL